MLRPLFPDLNGKEAIYFQYTQFEIESLVEQLYQFMVVAVG